MSAPDPGLLYMIGHYVVHIVVHHFDAELVQSWLPADLELMPQDISPPGKHPVNLLFGMESEVEVNWTKLLPGVQYNEFGMVIPFTRWKNAKYAYNGPFLFTPIIFVDKELISFGGEVVYGFPKRIGKFSISDTSYAVLDNSWPSDYARTSIADSPTVVTPEARQTITHLLQQPSVSQKADGSWSSSGFWWNLDTAALTDSTMKGEIIRYLLPGVPDGTRPFEGDGTSDFAAGAAYRMETDWTLTLPKDLEKDWSPWNDSGVPAVAPGAKE
ncbi:MAG: hypothetical protein Q8Q09_26980 [Deltaproteobacteria bacterium]|nr:hypothetical protein [Deltaproteobacteria bacterium]